MLSHITLLCKQLFKVPLKLVKHKSCVCSFITVISIKNTILLNFWMMKTRELLPTDAEISYNILFHVSNKLNKV